MHNNNKNIRRNKSKFVKCSTLLVIPNRQKNTQKIPCDTKENVTFLDKWAKKNTLHFQCHTIEIRIKFKSRTFFQTQLFSLYCGSSKQV